MTFGAPSFLAIWRAETTKLFSRLPAKAGLVIAAIIGVGGPLLLWSATHADITWNNTSLAESIDTSAAIGLQWSLEVRNFFFLRAFLMVLVALSVAGEFRARSTREDLVRPVPRWVVPTAKWLAVLVWVAATLLVAWVFGGLLGVIVYGFDGEWLRAATGYGATLLADAGFASLVLLVSVASRSVAGTIAGVFVYLIVDTLLGWALSLISMLSSAFQGMGLQLSALMEKAVALQPWLPSSAFGVWAGYAARAEWMWQSWVALGVITTVCLALTLFIFERLDVP